MRAHGPLTNSNVLTTVMPRFLPMQPRGPELNSKWAVEGIPVGEADWNTGGPVILKKSDQIKSDSSILFGSGGRVTLLGARDRETFLESVLLKQVVM